MRNHNSRPHIELIDLITQYQLCTVKKRFEIYRKQLTKSNKIYAFISLSVIVSRCVNRKKIHLIVGRYCGIGDTLNPAALSVLEEHLFIHTRACVPSSTFNFFFRFFFFLFRLFWAVEPSMRRENVRLLFVLVRIACLSLFNARSPVCVWWSRITHLAHFHVYSIYTRCPQRVLAKQSWKCEFGSQWLSRMGSSTPYSLNIQNILVYWEHSIVLNVVHSIYIKNRIKWNINRVNDFQA